MGNAPPNAFLPRELELNKAIPTGEVKKPSLVFSDPG